MSKIYDAIIGAMVGDAIGTPVKSLQRGTYAVRDMVGGGRFGKSAGTYSSNGASMLATMDAINKNKQVDIKEIIYNLKVKLPEGEFHCNKEVFDIDPELRKPNINALGRIIPLAFLPYNPENIIEITSITDANENAHNACTVYTGVCKRILWGSSMQEIIKTLSYGIWTNDFEEIGKIELLTPNDIKSTSDVTDTLSAALWCVNGTSSYERAVLLAANLGGNTNTLCSAVGGLAGLIYGTGTERGVPKKWIEKLQNLEYIERTIKIYEESVAVLS